VRARPGPFLVIPAFWLGACLLLPALLVLKISLSTTTETVPPYAPLLTAAHDGSLALTIHPDSYAYLFHDPVYARALLGSLGNAAITTGLCLLIGLPMALAITRAGPRLRPLLLLAVVLPFWTSFMIRIYALIGLLGRNGLINALLLHLGIIDRPLVIMNTEWAVAIGMTYAYLPFMVLPLYATFERLDPTLLEAAADLGATPFSALFRITLPLALPGIVAGSLLVFIPAVGEYVIPELLGGPNTLMIATQLFNEFFSNQDWPTASAVTIVLLVLLLAPLVAFERARALVRS
jgi:putrescine transport system permease protein